MGAGPETAAATGSGTAVRLPLAARKRVYIETYGCQMNISDGELMAGILEQRGYAVAETPGQADVVLVNTCAIREHAERRVLGRVSQLNGLKRDNPDLVIGVTGCMAQRMGDTLLERAPYVDLVMGPDGYRELPERLDALAEPGRRLSVLSLDPAENYEGLEQRRTSRISAWVPIQRGCDHRCTFCIVPYVRGPEKNRRPEEVLAEIRGIAANGVTEVTLLGQTVNSYARGTGASPACSRALPASPASGACASPRRTRMTSPPNSWRSWPPSPPCASSCICPRSPATTAP